MSPPPRAVATASAKQGSVMLAEPVAKKLIRNAYLGGPVLNPFQTDRHKPGIVDLFRHLA